MALTETFETWKEAITAEARRLARTKKMDAAPASAFPEFARHLGITDAEEDIRPRLKDILQGVAQGESTWDDDMRPLAKPALVLFGLTPRSAHKGIGARQKLAAMHRGVAPSSMRQTEVSLAFELGWLLLNKQLDREAKGHG